MKLPKCSGYEFNTTDAHEYDCYSIHEHDCEDCICNYKQLGGLWNPETGRKTNSLIAFILYGRIKYDTMY